MGGDFMILSLFFSRKDGIFMILSGKLLTIAIADELVAKVKDISAGEIGRPSH
jgi:hypothetical protein